MDVAVAAGLTDPAKIRPTGPAAAAAVAAEEGGGGGGGDREAVIVLALAAGAIDGLGRGPRHIASSLEAQVARMLHPL